MSTLIIADQYTSFLNPNIYNLVNFARMTKSTIHVIVIGCINSASLAQQISYIKGVDLVLYTTHDTSKYYSPDVNAQLVIYLQKHYKYKFIISSSSSFAKNFTPHIAALLGVSLIANVVAFEYPNKLVRSIYGGNLLLTVRSKAKVILLNIRHNYFASNIEKSTIPCKIVPINFLPNIYNKSYLNIKIKPNSNDLANAKVIVAGGKGACSESGFALIHKLAELLNGFVAGTRVAFDLGFIDSDQQIGQTGRIVSPDLYIAVGISGAIHHVSGMQNSKVIVAINNDPHADIFKYADYAIVDDLFDVIPQWISKIINEKKIK